MLLFAPQTLTAQQAAEAEDDAWDRAQAILAQPTRHPDRFRFLLPVTLPCWPAPVPCVAMIGIDRDGRPAVDGAWIFEPGVQAVWKHRGDDFNAIRAEAIGEHFAQLAALAAEMRAAHPLAA